MSLTRSDEDRFREDDLYNKEIEELRIKVKELHAWNMVLAKENVGLRKVVDKLQVLLDVLAEPAQAVLNESSAPNYVEILLSQDGSTEPTLALTLRRIDGLTPHQMRARVMQELYERVIAAEKRGSWKCSCERSSWCGEDCEFEGQCSCDTDSCPVCLGCVKESV